MGEEAFRAYPLDGAMSWFAPRTGLHVRWDGPETRALTRIAPRVVMFGLSHACNLACGFCGRDTSLKSAWTVESATQLLADLAKWGVLEVSFGGGEPLAFRGFDRLLQRLRDETPLAVHVTTNGVLLDEARIATLQGRVGEVRVSVYDGTPWEDRVSRLAAAGIRVGANVLVTPDRVAGLAALLERLREAGARDAAILSYVGSDPSLHLGPAADACLATVVAESPLPVRLSVCLGERLGLPLAFAGCAAGRDFVSIGPDKQVKPCSFGTPAYAIETADDVIAGWRRERATLARPAMHEGCARTHQALPTLSDGIRVFRAFAGNNSGDCVLVGRFDEAADARAYIEELAPGFLAGKAYSPEWAALLGDSGITPSIGEFSPESMLALGRSVLLHTDSTLADDFPSLRALLWKRGGRAVYNGIHEHGQMKMLVGLRGPDVQATLTAAGAAAITEPLVRHGADAFGLLPINGHHEGSMIAQGRALQKLADDMGAVIAAELVGDKGATLAKALPSLARPSEEGWLWVRFFNEQEAGAAAARLSPGEGLVATTNQCLLLRTGRVRSRLASRLQQHGGNVSFIGGPKVHVTCTFSSGYKDEKPDLDRTRALLRAELAAPFTMRSSFGNPVAEMTTDEPGPFLTAAVRVAAGLGPTCRLWPVVGPREVTAAALARVREDLVVLSRKRRK